MFHYVDADLRRAHVRYARSAGIRFQALKPEHHHGKRVDGDGHRNVCGFKPCRKAGIQDLLAHHLAGRGQDKGDKPHPQHVRRLGTGGGYDTRVLEGLGADRAEQ